MINHKLTQLLKKEFNQKNFNKTLEEELHSFSFGGNLKHWDFAKKGVTGLLDLYTGNCLLRAKYKLDGLKDKFDDSENEFKILLTEGHLSESILISWLRQYEEIKNIQTQKIVSNSLLMGFVDLYFEFEGEKYLADVKTVSQKNFDKIMSSQTAKEEHIAQTSIYALMMEEQVDRIVIFYYNANNFWTSDSTDIKKVVAINIPINNAKAKETINKNFKQIKTQTDYSKIQKGRDCLFCSYRDSCDSYLLENKRSKQ